MMSVVFVWMNIVKVEFEDVEMTEELAEYNAIMLLKILEIMVNNETTVLEEWQITNLLQICRKI